MHRMDEWLIGGNGWMGSHADVGEWRRRTGTVCVQRNALCVPLSALSQNRVNCVHLGTTTEPKKKKKKRSDTQLKWRRTTTLAPIAPSLLHAHLLAHPFVFSHNQKLPLNSFVASSSVSCLLCLYASSVEHIYLFCCVIAGCCQRY
jgi:hypothetical protein